MRENLLIARQKRRFTRTTDSEPAWPIAQNLVVQDFTADGPDRKWGADGSYILKAEDWLYLAIVLDLFSRREVGWATSDGLKRDLAVEAPCRALGLAIPRRSWFTIPTAGRNTARSTIRPCCRNAAS